MTREEKSQIIDELSEKFEANSHFYLTDASGLTVAQVNEFRRTCFNSGLEYGVYKNTLIRKALEKSAGKDYSGLFGVLNGFTGILFSREVANLPARVLKDIRGKLDGRPLLKAACIETEFYIGDNNLATLSELKSKEELIGDVIMLLQSPMKNLLSAIQSGNTKVAGLIKALEERAK